MNDTVLVRYIVADVDDALDFYTGQLGFTVEMHPAPRFAMLARGALRLALSAPGGAGGGGQAMPDGRMPEPGGWNRISLPVDDLDADVGRLRAAGATFRNDIVNGIGGKQILLDDPSGNPVELFQATPPPRCRGSTEPGVSTPRSRRGFPSVPGPPKPGGGRQGPGV